MTKRDRYDSTARDGCRVTCDCKALMLLRMHSDQKSHDSKAWDKEL